MKYILERKEYLEKLDEGFFSNVKDKIKKFFGGFIGKIGKWFIGVFTKNGLVSAISPVSTISYVNNMKPAGVSVFTNPSLAKSAQELGAGNVSTQVSEDIFVDKTEDNKDWKNSQIYKNLQELVKVINESVEVDGDLLAEKLDDLKAVAAGPEMAEVPDVNYNEFKMMIYNILDKVNDSSLTAKEKEYKVPIIFGAPGIGKTQIIKSIIDIINKHLSDKDKMSFIHINCSQLNPGELFMPTIPKAKELTSYVEQYKDMFDKDLAKYAQEHQSELDAQQLTFSSAPASWLPVYDTSGDKEAQRIGDIVANMGSYEDKDTGLSTKTGGGGILFFDEVLRAKPAVFSELMTFLQDGKMNKWKLGSKWIMICASNRPCDDIECEEAFNSDFGKAKRDRFAPVNYVPDPESWIKWAEKNKINRYIIKYIKKEPDMFYTTSDEVIKNNSGESFVIGANPRNWTLLSKAFDDQLRGQKFAKWDEDINDNLKEVTNIKKMDADKLLKITAKYLGKAIANKFVTWIKGLSDEEVSVEQIFANPDDVDITYDTASISNSLINNIYDQVLARSKKSEITSEEMTNLFCFLTTKMGLDPQSQRNLIDNFVRRMIGEVDDADKIINPDDFGCIQKVNKEKGEIQWKPAEKYRDALAWFMAYIPKVNDPIYISSTSSMKTPDGKPFSVVPTDPDFVELVGNRINDFFKFNIDENDDIIFYNESDDKRSKRKSVL